MSKRPGDRRGEHPRSLANLRPFLPGNQAARQHGGYARYHPPEVLERVTPDAPAPDRLENLIQLEEARLHELLQSKARWDAKAEYGELAGADYPLTSIRSDASGTTTTRERPDFERLIDRSMGRISTFIDQKERLAASPAYIGDKASQLLDKASDEGMSAVETAELFERTGIAPPFSIQQRARAELATLEPPEPEGGMTDAELERLSAEYEQQTQDEPDWLAERRRQVKEIHKSRDTERHGQ